MNRVYNVSIDRKAIHVILLYKLLAITTTVTQLTALTKLMGCSISCYYSC